MGSVGSSRVWERAREWQANTAVRRPSVLNGAIAHTGQTSKLSGPRILRGRRLQQAFDADPRGNSLEVLLDQPEERTPVPDAAGTTAHRSPRHPNRRRERPRDQGIAGRRAWDRPV